MLANQVQSRCTQLPQAGGYSSAESEMAVVAAFLPSGGTEAQAHHGVSSALEEVEAKLVSKVEAPEPVGRK